MRVHPPCRLCFIRRFELDGNMLRWEDNWGNMTHSMDLSAPGVMLSAAPHVGGGMRTPPAETPNVFAVSAPKRTLKLAFADIHERNAWFRAMSAPETVSSGVAPQSGKLTMPEHINMTLRLLLGRELAPMDSGTSSSDPYMQFWVASPPTMEARAEVVGFVDAGAHDLALQAVMPATDAATAMTARGVQHWTVTKAGKSKTKSRNLNPAWNETFHLNIHRDDVCVHRVASL